MRRPVTTAFLLQLAMLELLLAGQAILFHIDLAVPAWVAALPLTVTLLYAPVAHWIAIIWGQTPFGGVSDFLAGSLCGFLVYALLYGLFTGWSTRLRLRSESAAFLMTVCTITVAVIMFIATVLGAQFSLAVKPAINVLVATILLAFAIHFLSFRSLWLRLLIWLQLIALPLTTYWWYAGGNLNYPVTSTPPGAQVTVTLVDANNRRTITEQKLTPFVFSERRTPVQADPRLRFSGEARTGWYEFSFVLSGHQPALLTYPQYPRGEVETVHASLAREQEQRPEMH